MASPPGTDATLPHTQALSTPKRSASTSPDCDSSDSKRRRLSEDDVVIEEVIEPEYDSSYAIDSIIMHPAQDTFEPCDHQHRVATDFGPQQNDLLGLSSAIIDTTKYIPLHVIRPIAEWLHEHVITIQALDPLSEESILMYKHNAPTFSTLAGCLHQLLEVQDALEQQRHLHRAFRSQLLAFFETFYQDTIEFALRMTYLAPGFLDEALHSATSQQSIEPTVLMFPILAARFLSAELPFTHDLMKKHGFDFSRVKTAQKTYDLLPRVLQRLLDRLLEEGDRINGGWNCVEAILQLMGLPLYAKSMPEQSSTRTLRDLQHTVSSLHTRLLPVLSRKSPKTFRHSFYPTLYQSIRFYLKRLLERLDTRDVQSFLRMLWTMVGYQPDDTVEQLSSGDCMLVCRFTWQIEVAKTLIRTDFMTARKHGVCFLQALLQQACQDHKPSAVDLHPVIRAIRDIVVQSAIVPYIFGPQSHAGLMWNTKGILAFLALTGAWDIKLTDYVWSTCTESSDDELIKSAFSALDEAVQYLDYSNSLDLLTRFRTTKADKLSLFAAEFLDRLLRRINTTDTQVWAQSDQLAMPYMICMDILNKMDDAPPSPAVSEIYAIATTQLQLPLAQRISTSDQVAITEQCTKDIRQQTCRANVGSTILQHYLRWARQQHMPYDNFVVPSLDEAVADFVRVVRQLDSSRAAISMATRGRVLSRVELAMYLTPSAPPTTSELECEQKFWDHAVGHAAVRRLKQDALEHMLCIALHEGCESPAVTFLKRRLILALPSMPSSLASKSLITFLEKDVVSTHGIDATIEELNHDVLWQELLRLELLVQNGEVQVAALQAICKVLHSSPLASGFLLYQLEALAIKTVQLDDSHQCRYVRRSFEIFRHLLRDDQVVATLSINITKLESLLGCQTRNIAKQAFFLLHSLPLSVTSCETHLDADDCSQQLVGRPWFVAYAVDSVIKEVQHSDQAENYNSDTACKALVAVVDVLLNAMDTIYDDVLEAIVTRTNALVEIMLDREEYCNRDNQEARLSDLCSSLLKRARTVLSTCSAQQNLSLFASLYDLFLTTCRLSLAFWATDAAKETFEALHSCFKYSEVSVPYFSSIKSSIHNHLNKLPNEIIEAYMSTLTDVLPNVLYRPELAGLICCSLLDVVSRSGSWQTEERVSALLSSLTSTLWMHEHRETTLNRLQDNVIVSLLDLMHYTVQVLENMKGCSARHISAEDVFDRLLYPVGYSDATSSPSRQSSPEKAKQADTPADALQEYKLPPLLHLETRHKCFKLIASLCRGPQEYTKILQRFNTVIGQTESNDWRSSDDTGIRPATDPCGLINLGMTCYVNSLLQQIFSNIHLRSALLSLKIVDAERQKLLVHIQRLFSRLQDSVRAAISTSDLANAMNISPLIQDDVHSFYTIFMGALEDDILVEAERKRFMALYTGKSITRILGSCGHLSQQDETLNGLSITVQNKISLEASLAEYFHPEALDGDNKYQCTLCTTDTDGGFVSAVKSTHLESVPDNVSICLKRCSINAYGLEEKNNDGFHFPQQIDFACYQQGQHKRANSAIGPDMFTLVGVVVHTGTLSSGHYWSFVKRHNASYDSPTGWIRLEDHYVSYLSWEEMYKESVGGPDHRSSAYMLLYQRIEALDATESLLEPHLLVALPNPPKLPPRVSIPPLYRRELDLANRADYRTSHAFDPSLRDLLAFLTSANTRISYKDGTNDHSTDDLDLLCQASSNVTASYMINIALSRDDQADVKMIDEFLETTGDDAVHFLQALNGDKESTSKIYCHRNGSLVHSLSDSRRMALRAMKDSGYESYHAALNTTLDLHHRLLDEHIIERCSPNWIHYFGFLCDIARFGEQELDQVVMTGYIHFAAYVSQLGASGPVNTRQSRLTPPNADEFEVLLKFLSAVILRIRSASKDRLNDRCQAISPVLTTIEVQDTRILPWLLVAIKQDWTRRQLSDFVVCRLLESLIKLDFEGIHALLRNTIEVCCYDDDSLAETIAPVALACIRTYGSGIHSSRILLAILTSLDEEVIAGESIVDLLHSAMGVAPRAVIDSMHVWVVKCAAAELDQQKRAVDLVNIILAGDPIRRPGILDEIINRLMQVEETMSNLLVPAVESALPASQRRFIVTILEMFCAFRGRLQKQIALVDDVITDERLATAVQTLLDQCESVDRVLLSLGQWQASTRVRLSRSKVVEDTEEESSEDDEDTTADETSDREEDGTETDEK
ncbi:hypothetical protein AMS68_006616 [Peltaster fructicola]|uniref:USP domain-containing protein n=1 Tax=Peltaster fructicola TaxID=286661 RepID=A0A6H0Y2L8_9PEZI|nr:hypothetical protein AMS68_006616 [Peltaster fructicola]